MLQRYRKIDDQHHKQLAKALTNLIISSLTIHIKTENNYTKIALAKKETTKIFNITQVIGVPTQ
jgi:hypothetical protein